MSNMNRVQLMLRKVLKPKVPKASPPQNRPGADAPQPEARKDRTRPEPAPRGRFPDRS
jgi:hypothetical protein